jgi:hypothetical protein
MAENAKIRRFVEGIHSWLLLGLGGFYFTFEIADKFWKETNHATLILLNMVATLCLVLGLERFTTIALFRKNIEAIHATINDLGKKREDQLGFLESRIAEVLGTRLISGRIKVYGEGARLACTATRWIRTMLWIEPLAPAAPAPPEFAHAIAEHLSRNPAVSYEVVLAVDVSKLDRGFWRGMEARQDIYRERGVAKRVHVKVLNTSRPSGLDILVVDDKHVTFAFAPTPGVSEREIAVHFENQPELAQQMERWLRKTTEEAVPYSEVHFR